MTEADFIREAASRVWDELGNLLSDVADIVENDPDLVLTDSALLFAERIMGVTYND